MKQKEEMGRLVAQESNLNINEFKKSIDDFVQSNFSGYGNKPVMIYGSLKLFKKGLPEKDWIWVEKKKSGQTYYEVILKENENVRHYIGEHPLFDENNT